MTVTDQIKIFDRKIMHNEAQYGLDRKVAKISALPSNNLDKYEYLTGEDLGLKSGTVEQAKFEYYPLGKIFNKGLDKDDDKKVGLLKRLKNIEDKNEEQVTLFSRVNKTSSLAKLKVIIITVMRNLLFTGFTETFKTLKISHKALNTAT